MYLEISYEYLTFVCSPSNQLRNRNMGRGAWRDAVKHPEKHPEYHAFFSGGSSESPTMAEQFIINAFDEDRKDDSLSPEEAKIKQEEIKKALRNL